MIGWLTVVLRVAAAELKSRRNLLLENLALRHQLLAPSPTFACAVKRPMSPVGDYKTHPAITASAGSHRSDGAPRREFMEKLLDAIPDSGSVVAYNAIFEMGVLNECAEALPQFELCVRSVAPRFIDLLQPFRTFSYYHHAQRGSASMKAVLPAIAGRGYGDLAIRDGETASAEFLRVTFGQATAEERQRVRSSLLSYCGLDTLGMIRIVEGLRKAVGEN